MTSPSSSFLLPDLPSEIANSYLQRTYGWRPEGPSCRARIIFVCRLGSATDHSIHKEVVGSFPESCRLIQDKAGDRIFLISAHTSEFSRILCFLSKRQDSLLLPEIEKLLCGDSDPCFKIQEQIWRNDRPRIMGILNITPDSFFDGGKHFKQEDYAKIAGNMIDEGADIIDIGGESSRPGALPVDEAEEKSRVLKAVRQIRSRYSIPLSIDTVKPGVADAALASGADMINDISGLAAGEEMLKVVRKHRAAYCLMHIQGTPRSMQRCPYYTDVIYEILLFFTSKLRSCRDAGLENDRILLDPGIGFGKTVLDNWDLLRWLPAFKNLGPMLMVGTSNKSFIGKTFHRETAERLAGTLATQVLGWIKGAVVFRVHQVRDCKDALTAAQLITQGDSLS